MRKKKLFIILFVFIMIGLIGLLLIMSSKSSLTLDDTIPLEISIEKKEITGVTEKNLSFYSKTYTNRFIVLSTVFEHLNEDAVDVIQPGMVVFIRIESNKESNLNCKPFIDVVSLETENGVLFSLDDYNEYMSTSLRIPKILCSLSLLVLFVALLYFIAKKKSYNNQVTVRCPAEKPLDGSVD